MNIDRIRQLFLESGDEAPAKIGRYEVVREIAQGGSAVVYEAIDEELDRRVAVKVLKTTDGARIRREAQAAARLRHPNIIAIHEVGPNFIVMDYLPGKTLAEALPGLGRSERLLLLQTVARAIHHAHTQKVVHRDLKPSNILMGDDNRPVITDFGLAVITGEQGLTMPGTQMGTPGYMAPEQVRGKTQDPRVDVWALGILLYQMIVDRLPFQGDSVFELHQAIASTNPDLPAGPLGAVIMKALEKDPSRRYQTALDFADDLARFTRGDPVSAPRLKPWLMRRTAWAIGTALALMAVGLGVWWPRDESLSPASVLDVQAVFSAQLEALRSREDTETGALIRDPDSRLHLLARSESRWDRANLGRVLGRNPLPDFAAALEDIDHVLRLDPGHQDARWRRGRTLAQRAAYKRQYGIDPLADIADAEHSLGVVIDRPGSREWRANARFHRALWRIQLGMDGSADLAAAEADLTPADSPGKLMRRGRLRGYQRRFDEAEQDFEASIKTHPGDSWVWLFRGKTRLDAADPRSAEAHLGQAIKLNPLNAESWNLRGHARAMQGRNALAASDYEQALGLDPTLGPDTEARLRRVREQRHSDP